MRKSLIAFILVWGFSLSSANAISILESKNRVRAQKMLSAAVLSDRNGEFEQALHILNEAEKIEEIGIMTAVNIQIAKTSACVNLGRYQEAYKAYDKALKLAPDKGKADQIKLLAAELYFQTGRYEKGYQMLQTIDTDSLLLRRDIQIARMLQGLQRGKDAISLLDSLLKNSQDGAINNAITQNIGYLYWEMDSLDKAELYLRRAMLCMQEEPQELDKYNVALENHALVLSELGYNNKAISEITNVLNYNRQKRINSPIVFRKAAEIYFRAGDLNTSNRYFKQFFQIERRTLEENLPQMTQQQRVVFWERERIRLSKCFWLGKQDPEFLFEVAMFRRQTALLGLKDTINLNKFLGITPNSLRNSLKENEAAVEFITYKDCEGESWYAAVILSKYADARFVHLFNVEEIYKPEVVGNNSLYNAIKREDRAEIDLLYSDQRLGNLVWAPITAGLPENIDKIYFSPEGIFHLWGIENMPYDNSVNYDLRRVSSTASLINKDKQGERQEPSSKLIIGGLDYDSPPQMEEALSSVSNHESRNILHNQLGENKRIFKYLNESKTEVDSIANLYKILVHHEMGESNLKRIMSDYQVIHIATHGYSLNLDILPISELRVDSLRYDWSLSTCGLALTGANIFDNDSCDDNILSAREIFDMDLSNVDFVILSACQTAKGDIIDEGAAGLVRGLKNAGVKVILATLWSVNDYSTMSFMKSFHAQLILGKSPAEALRTARESLINGNHPRIDRKFSPATLASEYVYAPQLVSYEDPYYWAPFILIDAIN